LLQRFDQRLEAIELSGVEVEPTRDLARQMVDATGVLATVDAAAEERAFSLGGTAHAMVVAMVVGASLMAVVRMKKMMEETHVETLFEDEEGAEAWCPPPFNLRSRPGFVGYRFVSLAGVQPVMAGRSPASA
jgi:hypothetical protein